MRLLNTCQICVLKLGRLPHQITAPVAPNDCTGATRREQKMYVSTLQKSSGLRGLELWAKRMRPSGHRDSKATVKISAPPAPFADRCQTNAKAKSNSNSSSSYTYYDCYSPSFLSLSILTVLIITRPIPFNSPPSWAPGLVQSPWRF